MLKIDMLQVYEIDKEVVEIKNYMVQCNVAKNNILNSKMNKWK